MIEQKQGDLFKEYIDKYNEKTGWEILNRSKLHIKIQGDYKDDFYEDGTISKSLEPVEFTTIRKTIMMVFVWFKHGKTMILISKDKGDSQ